MSTIYQINNKNIWIENPNLLFTSLNILPMNNMNIEAQINTFSRLIIVIFIILFLLGFKYSYVFLFLSLIFIIILYYIQRNKMESYQKIQENFESCDSIKDSNTTPYGRTEGTTPYGRTEGTTPYGRTEGTTPYDRTEGTTSYDRTEGTTPYGRTKGTTIFNTEKSCLINPKPKYNSNNFKYQNEKLARDVYIPGKTLKNGYDISPKVNTYVKSTLTNNFCCDNINLEHIYNDPNYVSINQKLVGPPNPITNIKPVVVEPSHDLSFWKANNLINYSQINSLSQREQYLNGYAISECCGYLPENARVVTDHPESYIETFEFPSAYHTVPNGMISPQPIVRKGIAPSLPLENMDYKENYKFPSAYHTVPNGMISPQPIVRKGIAPSLPLENMDYKENYKFPSAYHTVPNGMISPQPIVRKGIAPSLPLENMDYKENFNNKNKGNNREKVKGGPQNKPNYNNFSNIVNTNPKEIEQLYYQSGNSQKTVLVTQNEPGWVNTSCGYNPKQIFTSNLPSNYAAGNCEKGDSMSEYNKNLYTQTIQPGVYTRNQIIEPINSNIGISFQQQFEPLTSVYQYDPNSIDIDKEELIYTQHDPRIIEPVLNQSNIATIDPVNVSNIYDPRFNGYGTSYRAYTDKNLGQTKFMYDDINAIKMPNYISRSNIDFEKYADSYGPLKEGEEFGNKYNDIIRPLAQHSWLQSNLDQRNSLSESLLRKRNSEMHELRKYPKSQQQYTQGSRRIF
jgi:hypothetical protein